MKIMIAGDWKWPHYEAAFAQALSAVGHLVIPFSFSQFFKGKLGHYQSALPVPAWTLLNINSALLKCVRNTSPDLVLVWRGTHVLPTTIKKIKQSGTLTASYNNDDPFGPPVHGNTPWHHRFLWVWYQRCLKNFDFNFVYRPINLKEAVSYGAKNVKVLMPYFLPWQERPVALSDTDNNRFGCDVVFIGHYEPDGRCDYLRALVNNGINVRLFGEQYVKALCGAKICLSFLSRLNRDVYTRRCFEIPACGRLLMCERSDELTNMFIEDEEAVFFSSIDELVTKAKWLIKNQDVANKIALAGNSRVWADGHDVQSRARQFLSMVNNGKYQ